MQFAFNSHLQSDIADWGDLLNQSWDSTFYPQLLNYLHDTGSIDIVRKISEKDFSITSLSPTERSLVTLALLFAMTYVHDVTPHFPKIMVVIDEGIDRDTFPQQEKMLELLCNRIRANRSMMLVCILHDIKPDADKMPFDVVHSLTNTNGVCHLKTHTVHQSKSPCSLMR